MQVIPVGRRWRWMSAVALLVAVVAVPLAFAGGPAFPKKAKVEGHKPYEWSQEWW